MTFIVDGTNGLTFNNSTTQASAGVVLQVVQTVLTTAFSTTSTSYTDVTGLSVSITPKFSTSKILVTASIGGQDSSYGDCFTQLVRGSTAIGNSTAGSTTNGFAFASGASTAQAFSSCFVYLDSPATTSATTYKVQLLNDNTGTAYINRRASGADLGATSTITVMEIAA